MRKLSEQQAICDAATPGSWYSVDEDIVLKVEKPRGIDVRLGEMDNIEDAQFIVAARNDYPALIEWAKSARELLHDMGMDGDLSPMHGEVNLHRYRDRFQQLLRELQP